MALLALVWGIVLRVFHLAKSSYWIDESYSMSLAHAIRENGYPLLGSGEILWRDPIYHYLLAATTIISESPWVTRGLSIGIGVGSIIVITMIAKRWYGTLAATFTALFMSLGYWQIAWSRQIRMYELFLLLSWSIFLFVDKWIESKNKKTVIVLIFFAIAVLGTHIFGVITIAIAILMPYIQKLSKGKPSIKTFFLYLQSIFLPLIFIGAGIFVLKEPIAFPVNYLQQYLAFIGREYPVISIFAISGILIGLGNIKTRMKSLWLIVAGTITLGVVSFEVPLLQYRYIYFMTPVLFLSAAYFLSYITTRGSWTWAVVAFGMIGMIISGEIQLVPETTYLLESDNRSSEWQYKSITPQPPFVAGYEALPKKSIMLITAYPTISELYGFTDGAAIAVDLTGANQESGKNELYTGTPFITIAQLQKLQDTDQEVYLLFDFFAQHRMNNALRMFIESKGELVQEWKDDEWSSLWLYRL